MKIGIYTIHSHFNYGAMLQAYATQKAIEKMGFEVLIVNLFTKKEEKKNKLRSFDSNFFTNLKYSIASLHPDMIKKFSRFEEFHNDLNLTKRYYSKEELFKNPPIMDLHLVGSDQVWNLQNGVDEYFFLTFLKPQDLRMSYASSFGTSNIDDKYKPFLKKHLSLFSSIGVRENDGVTIVKESTGLEAKQVLDPTFLLSENEWNSIISERLINEDYVLYYGFDNSKTSKSIIENIRVKLKIKVVAVSASFSFPHEVDRFVRDAGPKEFLNLIKYSKFVIASSFHGVALAIKFKKSFFSIKHPTRNSRMETILTNLGLLERQMESPQKILTMSKEELFIDYNHNLNKKISEHINESNEWFKEAVHNLLSKRV